MSYHQHREQSSPKGKQSDELTTIIEEKLSGTWSPEQISNTLIRGKVSFKTIYNLLYQGKLSHVNETVLRQKGKRQKPAEKRGKFTVGT